LAVERLRRVAFGALELGDLPEGHWRELGGDEVAALSAGGPGPPPAGPSP
jgi:16S rRNA U516 pseudouridylate synthase RsuA-like enzyme